MIGAEGRWNINTVHVNAMHKPTDFRNVHVNCEWAEERDA